MGLLFGHLWKYYGRVTYRLSPFEMNPLKGILNPGFTNTCRRFGENVPTMAPRKFIIHSIEMVCIAFLFVCFLIQSQNSFLIH